MNNIQNWLKYVIQQVITYTDKRVQGGYNVAPVEIWQ